MLYIPETVTYKPWDYNFVRGFRWAYKRRALYPRGLITGIKKPFRNELKQCWSKYVFYLLVLNEALKRHNKSNSFRGKLSVVLFSLQVDGPVAGGTYKRQFTVVFWLSSRSVGNAYCKCRRGVWDACWSDSFYYWVSGGLLRLRKIIRSTSTSKTRHQPWNWNGRNWMSLDWIFRQRKWYNLV